MTVRPIANMADGDSVAPIFASDRYIASMVTIITPVFNRAALVGEALDSVMQQDYPKIELILVDDGSTDHLMAAMALWQAANPDANLRILHQPNKGPAAARNFGIGQSNGEFIYFLDSDDLVCPRSLSVLIAAVRHENAPYALGRTINVNMAGEPQSDQNLAKWTQSSEAVTKNQWMTHAALYRRSTIAKAGAYDEALACGEDTEFHWRIAALNGRGAEVDVVIAYRRSHSFGQLSDQDITDQIRNINAAIRQFEHWALKLDILKPADRQSLAMRHLRHAIECGARGEWLDKERSIARIATLYTNSDERKPLVFQPFFQRPTVKIYYKVLLRIANHINNNRIIGKLYRLWVKRTRPPMGR